MNVFGTASAWAKIVLLLVFVALGVHVAGFATTFWQQTETIQEATVYDIGLWSSRNCSGGHDAACYTGSVPDSYISTSFKVVRGLEIIVIVLVFAVLLVAALYVSTERFREQSIALFVIVMCFVTATVGTIALIVWVAQIPSDYYLGYSCGLCALAISLLVLAGILMLPDIRQFQQRHNTDRLKVRPDPRQTYVTKQPKYMDEGRHDYSYNKRFTPTPETPQTQPKHYYNPHRDPYLRSPPPAYKTSSSPEYKSHSNTSTIDRDTHSDIQTPDVYLGRDARRPRRY